VTGEPVEDVLDLGWWLLVEGEVLAVDLDGR